MTTDCEDDIITREIGCKARKVPLERAIEGTKKSEGKKDGIMRRILSMLLCLAMLCVLCAGAAVAEGEKMQFEI